MGTAFPSSSSRCEVTAHFCALEDSDHRKVRDLRQAALWMSFWCRWSASGSYAQGLVVVRDAREAHALLGVATSAVRSASGQRKGNRAHMAPTCEQR